MKTLLLLLSALLLGVATPNVFAAEYQQPISPQPTDAGISQCSVQTCISSVDDGGGSNPRVVGGRNFIDVPIGTGPKRARFGF